MEKNHEKVINRWRDGCTCTCRNFGLDSCSFDALILTDSSGYVAGSMAALSAADPAGWVGAGLLGAYLHILSLIFDNKNMKHRDLFIAAYDITKAKRLRRFLKLLRQYSENFQKSVFECWLNKREKEELLEKVSAIIEEKEDRFFLFKCHANLSAFYFGHCRKNKEHIYLIN